MTWVIISLLTTAIVLRYINNTTRLWWIVWPGTVVHEVMHALVGLVLLANPTNFSVLPKAPVPGQVRIIGSVDFYSMNWFNTMPIALAPLLSIPLIFMNLQYMHFPKHFSLATIDWKVGVIIFLLANVLSQAIPSGIDWQVIKKRPFGIFFWLTVIAAVSYYNVPMVQNIVHQYVKV